jgi:hypothetical protein
MFSAGVDIVLAEFFLLWDMKTSNIPSGNNIPFELVTYCRRNNNIPVRAAGNIPPEFSNIPLKSLVMEVLAGKQKA